MSSNQRPSTCKLSWPSGGSGARPQPGTRPAERRLRPPTQRAAAASAPSDSFSQNNRSSENTNSESAVKRQTGGWEAAAAHRRICSISSFVRLLIWHKLGVIIPLSVLTKHNWTRSGGRKCGVFTGAPDAARWAGVPAGIPVRCLMLVQTQQQRPFQDRWSSGMSPSRCCSDQPAAVNTPLLSLRLIKIPCFYRHGEHLISSSEDSFSHQKINVYLQYTVVMETGKGQEFIVISKRRN